ncbi:MAG: YpdA family putative bacillithiol disulfide reductase [Bacteroidota bacterium]|nr:YpdA family putative bacillithiol disulfide reductase [Bacteroidota bacterium]
MFDAIIIGAGPAGLSTAIEAQKAGLNSIVIEKGSIVNSIQHFPAEMSFFSTPELLEIGGLPFTSSAMRPTRVEGLEYYTRVADFYKLQLKLFEEVNSVQKNDNVFSIQTDKNKYQSKAVVVATGYYDNPNMLGIPGENLPKVSHYYDEPYGFYRQNVAVIGGKNSAAIAALELFRHGANVTLIHRKEKLSDGIKYWILPDIENRIKEGSVKAFFSTKACEIWEKELLLENDRGERFTISNDFVFALIGYHPNADFLRSVGVEVNTETVEPKCDPNTFETNVAGLYVAGSIVAGKNNNKIFIENGRLHGKAIVGAICSHAR